MSEKTIQGKKCPKCQSFVMEGSKACPVCGFNWEEGGEEAGDVKDVDFKIGSPEGHLSSPASVTCPKCGTDNSPDFRFCKICKHPLQAVADSPGTPDRAPRFQVRLKWTLRPEEGMSDIYLDLEEMKPYFTGNAGWNDHVFLVYSCGSGHQILARRNQVGDSSSILFKRSKGLVLADSGQKFYMGAVGFQLLGDPSHKDEVKTVMRSDKTVLRGPGEEKVPRFLNGAPRIKIVNLNPEAGDAEITESTMVGRGLLAEHCGLDEDELRLNGISKDHFRLTPYPQGKWLVEPVPGKPLFEEISEIPVRLISGDTLRWVSDNQVGEFEIHIIPKEV
jgi:hypothetical protein